jgi:hypothetical protein
MPVNPAVRKALTDIVSKYEGPQPGPRQNALPPVLNTALSRRWKGKTGGTPAP